MALCIQGCSLFLLLEQSISRVMTFTLHILYIWRCIFFFVFFTLLAGHSYEQPQVLTGPFSEIKNCWEKKCTHNIIPIKRGREGWIWNSASLTIPLQEFSFSAQIYILVSISRYGTFPTSIVIVHSPQISSEIHVNWPWLGLNMLLKDYPLGATRAPAAERVSLPFFLLQQVFFLGVALLAVTGEDVTVGGREPHAAWAPQPHGLQLGCLWPAAVARGAEGLFQDCTEGHHWLRAWCLSAASLTAGQQHHLQTRETKASGSVALEDMRHQ